MPIHKTIHLLRMEMKKMREDLRVLIGSNTEEIEKVRSDLDKFRREIHNPRAVDSPPGPRKKLDVPAKPALLTKE